MAAATLPLVWIGACKRLSSQAAKAHLPSLPNTPNWKLPVTAAALLLLRVWACKTPPLGVAKANLPLPPRAPSWELHVVLVEGSKEEGESEITPPPPQSQQNDRKLTVPNHSAGTENEIEHFHMLSPDLGNQGSGIGQGTTPSCIKIILMPMHMHDHL